MSKSSLLKILDELEGILKKKKQAKYLSIAGFSFLLFHALTHVPILLVMALILFGVSVYLRMQIRTYSKRNAKKKIIAPIEFDEKAQTSHAFESKNTVPSISIQLNDVVNELTILYEKEDWEDDDILLLTSPKGKINIHPSTFFEYLKQTDCNYLHDQDPSYIESLKNTPCIKFGYLEDSRDYPSIIIAGCDVSIMCKYLCPIFYIFSRDEGIIILVDELRDEDGKEIPTVITSLQEDIFHESTAEFSVEESVWVQK